ncbi:MAG: hypothetical protein J6K53_13050, partial [Roseburia sp.]|nr:hypothetical protein [Roseburia sp.]
WKKIWRDIADSCSDDWRRMSNNLRELWENGSKKLSAFGDDIQAWWKKLGETTQVSGRKGLKSNLTQDVIDEIVSKPKGNRPDPKTYLSQEYIEEHLKQFEGGAAYILPESDYDLYYRGVPEIAREDGTLFVTSEEYLNRVLQEADGDLAYVEKALGYPTGSLSEGNFKIVGIDNPSSYDISMPSGNEAGANSEWIPGGYTSGGVPEAVVHNVPNDSNVIDINTVRLERK